MLGRRTYEGFASAWPSMTDEVGFADKMNTMPKYVVSSTLEKAEWPGSRLIRGNVADEVRRLREEPGQDLLLSGSAQVFNALKDEDLIDLYRFMVHPVILGKGARLFSDDQDQRSLKLTTAKPFKSGIVILEYERV